MKRLFVEYEKAFDALDIEKITELYTDSFVSAGPNGMIAHNKAEFLKEARKASEFYGSIDQESGKTISLEETPISEAS